MAKRLGQKEQDHVSGDAPAQQVLELVTRSAGQPARSADDNETFGYELIRRDAYLRPHRQFFEDMQNRIRWTEQRITGGMCALVDFAAAHEYFGLHLVPGPSPSEARWVFREWAPNARAIWLTGQFSGWRREDRFALHPIGGGKWELTVPADWIHHGDLYKLWVEWPGGAGERLPAYVRRAVQDSRTQVFAAQVWEPPEQYQWRCTDFKPKDEPLLIYEAHVGMALEDGRVGTYIEFRERILPRIVHAGYNAIQLMAIQEHPYYGSFGYQVSNFFAPSSRFGTPEELKALIDAAHAAGLSVFLDLVHSHSVKNELEGLSRLDGTLHQYFHSGDRGNHPVWDSRLFDYGKTEVLHFLLSNIKYWIDGFRFDGFRFDGVTSMLFIEHGLKDPFNSYDRYFNHNLDRDALVYVALANKMAHTLGKKVVTIAEDVSGMPGLAAPLEHGGFGFDLRLAMGIPDFWVRTIKEQPDEKWNVEWLFGDLVNRRADEQTISYAESHDQALVGDQTIIFRLLQTLMYHRMRIEQQDPAVQRGLALHCLIRLLTVTTAGHGYLNFMGNEFGHPEWIDFPRQGNNWSYHYARRQWSLRDNPALQYHRLAEFDREMINVVKQARLFSDPIIYKHYSHVEHQVLVYSRAGYLFLFNFSPNRSYADYIVDALPGEFEMAFNSDEQRFAGHGRLDPKVRYVTRPMERYGRPSHVLQVYLPTRTAMVLRKIG